MSSGFPNQFISRDEVFAASRELEKALALTEDRRARPFQAPRAQATAPPPRAAAVKPAACPAPAAPAASNPQRSAQETMDSLVGHLTKQGFTRAEAVKEVFRTDPGLQKRLVAEANAGKPKAGRARPRPDLADRVAAYADVVPRFGQPVA